MACMAVWYQLWVPALTFAVLFGALLCLGNLRRSKGFSWGLRLPKLFLKEEQLPRVTRAPPNSEAEFLVAPCSRVQVEWRGVHLTVDCDNHILTNCSGSAQPSHITAIIGYASEASLRRNRLGTPHPAESLATVSWDNLPTSILFWSPQALRRRQNLTDECFGPASSEG